MEKIVLNPSIKAIYVAVNDMNRAISFYEDLFSVKCSFRDERMSSFEFDNITLLLYNPEIDNEEIYRGNNVVICIEVENLNKILRFLEKWGCEIIMPLKEIDNFKLFQAKDTEGNIIEFYEILK